MDRFLLLTALLLAQTAEAQPVATIDAPTETPGTRTYPDPFARDTYRIDTLVCPFKRRIDYDPGNIECGLLQVPENREDPDSRYIELHFVKLNSTWDDEDKHDDDDDDSGDNGLAPGQRDDPVIYLTGGPGARVETYVRRFKDHGIRKHRDLYILEQRGIGSSADFCANYFTRKPEIFDVSTLAEQAAAQIAAASDCALNALAAGVDVGAYNTIENARDVKALRLALGFDDWNVWGISYGSVLGQAYLKEDPEGIRAVALDAIVPLDSRADPLFWRIVNWYDRDLKKLDELCAADRGCRKRYPDLSQRVREVASAVSDEPIEVSVEDTERYPSGKAVFFSDIAAFLPFAFLYEQYNYAALPGLIYTWTDIVMRRDENVFKAFALFPGSFFPGSQGMYDAIMCNDGHIDAQVASVRADREEFPVLAAAISVEGNAERQAQRCRDVGLMPRDRADFAPVQTDIPALIIEGDMDPITPPPLARAILPGFANGTYVEFPYAGHGPSRSVECAGDMLNKFYDDPEAEPDLSCVDEMETPEFWTPFFATTLVPRMVVLANEHKKTVPAVAAWAGASVLITLVSFVWLSIAALGRRLDRRNAVATDGARLATWGAAGLGTLAVVVIGAAAGVTYEVNPALLFFGLAPFARFGSLAVLVSGVLAVLALVLLIRTRRRRTLPIGTLTGLALAGVGIVSLTALFAYVDLIL